jgi:hypothetical protein
MKSNAVFLVFVSLLAFCQTAVAQPAQCMVCRAEYVYGHCPKDDINSLPKGFIALIGTVAAAKPIHCGTQIIVNVARSSLLTLPAKIVIDVLPCSFWVGTVGDTISAVVLQAPQQTGVYTSSILCTPAK